MRYFYDVVANGQEYVDAEGIELKNGDAARREADQSLLSIAQEELTGSTPQEFRVTVRNEKGIIYQASLHFEGMHVA